MSKKIIRFMGLTAIAVALALPVSAVTVKNTVSYSNGGTSDPGCGPGENLSDTGAGDLKVGFSRTAPGCKSGLRAVAVGGGLGIFAQVENVPGGTTRLKGEVSAATEIRDIFLTPTTYTGPTVIQVTVNLTVDGGLRDEVRSNANFVRVAGSSVRATATLGGGTFGAGNTTSSFRQFDDNAGVSNGDGDGLETKTITGALFPTITHDWRIPLSLRMQISGSAVAVGGGDSTAIATLSSEDTFSFSKTGPAFSLPDGFTVNAPEINIFNNRWIDPRVTVTPSTVPLPAGLPLLLAGIGVLGLVRRKQEN